MCVWITSCVVSAPSCLGESELGVTVTPSSLGPRAQGPWLLLAETPLQVELQPRLRSPGPGREQVWVWKHKLGPFGIFVNFLTVSFSWSSHASLDFSKGQPRYQVGRLPPPGSPQGCGDCCLLWGCLLQRPSLARKCRGPGLPAAGLVQGRACSPAPPSDSSHNK